MIERESTVMYGSRFFPKLLNELIQTSESNKKKGIQEVKTEIKSEHINNDIFRPSTHYTKGNIGSIIWIICNIAVYWYHDDTEKIVHVGELIEFFVKIVSRIDKVQRQLWMDYAIDAFRLFGDVSTITENLSYFIQNIGSHSKYKIDWKALSNLAIAYRNLDIGLKSNFNETKGTSQWLDSTAKFVEVNAKSSMQFAPVIDVEIMNDKEVEELIETKAKLPHTTSSVVGTENDPDKDEYFSNLSPVHKTRSNHTIIKHHDPEVKEFMNPIFGDSISYTKKFSSELKSDNNNQPVYVFDQRKKTSKVSSFDPNHSDLKPDEMDFDFLEDEEIIEVRERSLDLEKSEHPTKYNIILVSKWGSWGSELQGKPLKKLIHDREPDLDHNIKFSEKLSIEAKKLWECPSCSSPTLKIEIMVVKIWYHSDIKAVKKTKEWELDFYPPFLLFTKLEQFIKECSQKLKLRMSEIESHLDKCKLAPDFNTWLILDVLKLRKENEKLFWNLIYRFIWDRRPYKFMLPYEKDMFPNDATKNSLENYKITLKAPSDSSESPKLNRNESSNMWSPMEKLTTYKTGDISDDNSGSDL